MVINKSTNVPCYIIEVSSINDISNNAFENTTENILRNLGLNSRAWELYILNTIHHMRLKHIK